MNKHGFTLIEILVALAILSILLMTLNQILVSTANTTILSMKHIEADKEARLALDRISYDISKMVQRSDVDYYFPATQNGNDQFYIYSESTGYFLNTGLTPAIPATASINTAADPRGEVSLIGYRINSNSSDLNYNKLERLSKGLTWNGVTCGGSTLVPMAYLPQTISATWNLSSNPLEDTDFQSLGDGVFRFAVSYLVENTGQTHATPMPTPTPSATMSIYPNLEGNQTPGTVGYFNPRDVIAIVISIAVLDPNTQKIVTPSQLNQAAQLLASPSSSTPLPLATWEQNQFKLGLPKQAAEQVRFYQRYCYLNHTAF
jgi:prepilin-type N-terminal cleavage/methylation domain-containing protein